MSKRRNRAGHGFWAGFVLLFALGAAAVFAGGWLDANGWGSLAPNAGSRQDAVRISEVQADNRMTLPDAAGIGWIELENVGDAPVSLRGLCLTRDEKLNKTLALSDGTLEPGAFLLIYADAALQSGEGDALHAPFRLPDSGEHALYLYDEAANLIDSVTVPDMKADESYCRDETGAWQVTALATPGGPNRAGRQIGDTLAPGDVSLNEIVCANTIHFPDEDGEFCDYVELANHGKSAVSLEGYCLTDDVEKPDKWRFPSVSMPAGSFLALHCSGKNRTDDPAHLHTKFKLSANETVYLFKPDGELADMVNLTGLERGRALSRADGRWTLELPPTPNRENTQEAALSLDGENRAARAGGVYISEIMALPDGETPDWVELHNDGDADADLSGWGFSDNLKKPRKWQLPSGTTVPAHGYRVLAMTGDDQTPASGWLSAPFALSGAGGYALTLCDPTGALKDVLYVPEQSTGLSFGRTDDGACGFFEKPTPNKANGSTYTLGRARKARCSVDGGLFEKGERLEIALEAEPDARIHYTLDCSDPDENDALYDGTPIAVTKSTVLRTRVYRENHLPSDIDTQSYLFDVQAAGEVPYVVSLVSDPKNLYDKRTGIMVLGKHRNIWQEWKREAHVEVFVGGDGRVISQGCEIKLHGRNTRGYPLKSFKVMAKQVWREDI